MLDRLFPRQADNRFEGRPAALWMLGVFIALRLIMSVNSIVNTWSIATGDGLPLGRYSPEAARTMMMLFDMAALGQLTLAVIALVVLMSYRALVPLIYLALLGDQLARRVIAQTHEVARVDTGPIIWLLTWGLVILLAIGLVLSLIPAPRAERA